MDKKIMILLMALTFSINAIAQTFTLRGKVTDEDQNPVELATVACLKQGKVAMTSLKGEYSLKLQSADSVVIQVSMIRQRHEC